MASGTGGGSGAQRGYPGRASESDGDTRASPSGRGGALPGLRAAGGAARCAWEAAGGGRALRWWPQAVPPFPEQPVLTAPLFGHMPLSALRWCGRPAQPPALLHNGPSLPRRPEVLESASHLRTVLNCSEENRTQADWMPWLHTPAGRPDERGTVRSLPSWTRRRGEKCVWQREVPRGSLTCKAPKERKLSARHCQEVGSSFRVSRLKFRTSL